MTKQSDSIKYVCPNGCPNPTPAWWPPPLGATAPPCSNCDAPLKKRPA